MSKSSNFFGQPIYGQLIKSLDREKIVEISRKTWRREVRQELRRLYASADDALCRYPALRLIA